MDSTFKPDKASGLLLPEGARVLNREVWPHDDVKKVKRFHQMMQHYQLNILVVCTECNTPVQWQDGPTGPIGLCGCKKRELQ